MSVLVCSTESPGELVSKEKLLQTVWPNPFVGEGVLTRSIFKLRLVFEDEAKERRVIRPRQQPTYRRDIPSILTHSPFPPAEPANPERP
jgi:DNA-binding winged helix-turn-helix (wHTH) protein